MTDATELLDTLPPEQAERVQQIGMNLLPLIQRIPMKRWLGIARRYDVNLIDIQRDPTGRMNELIIIAGNEVRRIQTGADCWDEIEDMGFEEVSALVVDHLTVTDPEEDEADKRGLDRADPEPGPVQPGDRDAS